MPVPALKRQIPDLILDYAAADWRKVGDWFFLEENYEKAAMAYSKMLTVPPTNDNQCMTMYALSKYHIGDLASCRWAVKEVFLLDPDNAFATHVEGLLFNAEGDWEASELALLESVVKIPDQPDFRLNLAYLYQILGRFKDAQLQYEAAIKLNPANLRARFFRSLSLLTQGKFEEGFKEYEVRYSMIPLVPQIGKPIWRGQEDIAGKTILLCAEQGLGDAIQFSRYGQWLKDKHRVKRAIILARKEYVDLLKRVWGIDDVVDKIDADSAEFEYLAPLMSMPGLSMTEGAPWYGVSPYMSIPASDTLKLQSEKLKVGFCWQGNRQHQNDRFRSIKPELFDSLLDMDICAVSLQHDEPLLRNMNSLGIGGILELAQAIDQLDLVITVDTATAHIAGALGKEVWMMVPVNVDFRWGLGSSSTPWYPSMKIFRQTEPLKWGPVLKSVEAALAEKISS